MAIGQVYGSYIRELTIQIFHLAPLIGGFIRSEKIIARILDGLGKEGSHRQLSKLFVQLESPVYTAGHRYGQGTGGGMNANPLFLSASSVRL